MNGTQGFTMDVMVRCKKGGTNVLLFKDLKIIGGNQLKEGTRVKMMWYSMKCCGKAHMGTQIK